jgi:hypothetical protein
MAKQGKELQGYRTSPPCCMNCYYFRSEVVPLNRWPGDTRTREKNKRCFIGGFPVTNYGHCDFFRWNAERAVKDGTEIVA